MAMPVVKSIGETKIICNRWTGGWLSGRDEEGNGKNERPDKIIEIILSGP